ncbi:MAG: S-layer protein domain-containing protein [Candidatus Methanogasteraceae archaeon]
MRKIIFLLAILCVLMQTAHADLVVTGAACNVTLDARYGDASAQEATVKLKLENTGNASITVYAPSFDAPEEITLSAPGTYPLTLGAGASKNVQINVCVAGTASNGTHIATAYFDGVTGSYAIAVTVHLEHAIAAPGEVTIRGKVAEPTGAQTEGIVWDACNFAAFPYDLNCDIATETLAIAPGTLPERDHYRGRTIDAGNLTYRAEVFDADFDYDGWGRYEAVNFMAERYFAGYESDSVDNVITADDISILSKDMLTRVLIDEHDNHTIALDASIELKGAYELKLVQLDANGNQAQIELLRNGMRVDTDVMNVPDTYVYRKDLGRLDDVPIIAVRINNIYVGTETDMMKIGGIFQISDEYISVDAGDTFGEMEVASASAKGIRMANYDSIELGAGKTIDLMDDIKFVVAENETLRFAPIVVMTEPGTCDLRGAVQRLYENQTDEIVWNASNSAPFWYDIDRDVSTETLSIAPGTLSQTRTISEGYLSYATHPAYQEYEVHKNEGLTVCGQEGYMAEGWIGRRYVAVGGRADKLSEPLVEFGSCDKKTLRVGETWDIGGEFSLTPERIDSKWEKVWLTLEKNGKVLLPATMIDTSAGCNRICTYTANIGGVANVTVFSCYVDAVFRGTDSDVVQVEYVFLINDVSLEINAGDEFGRMAVMTANPAGIALLNNRTIDLHAGTTEEVMGGLHFMTADSGMLRFYPFIRHVIGGGSDGSDDCVIFDRELEVNAGIVIEHSILIEVAEIQTDIIDSAKLRISSHQKPARTITVFQGDSPTEYKTSGGASIYIEVLSVYGDSVSLRITGPADWAATGYYTEDLDDDANVILNRELTVNSGVEIEHSIKIEVVEVKTDIIDSAKLNISSYQKPARTISVFQGDSPTEYETSSGASIYIEVLSVYSDSVSLRITGPEDWRVTNYYTVEPEEDFIPATDSDHDGVPDVWDEEPDTPAGYWTDSTGRGRRWGDLNGDGRLTSADALLILEAAVGSV